MTRSRTSAKAAGTRMERLVADTLAEHLDDRIDRKVRGGAIDRGDVGGVRVHGRPLTIEVKDVSRTDLSGWVREAEVERVNDGGLAGIVVHKRRGDGDGLDQYVTMTVRDLIAIISGERPGV